MERDEIPPIDVLEAAARREREETEELLAGFDRPGRSPRRAKKRDVLAGYAGEEAPRILDAQPEAQKRREPTFVVPRTGAVPPWAPWAGLAVLMVLFGGLVAFLATAEPTAAPALAPTALPSSVTTITSAKSTRVDDVPPPPPIEPSAAPVPTSPRPRDTAPAAPSGPTPREDFIRRF